MFGVRSVVLVLCLLIAALVDCIDNCDVVTTSTDPQGVHLAYAGSANSSIAISFFTCGAGGEPQVYIISDSSSVRTVNGTSSRYYKRYHHDIILSDLAPGTLYTYSVGLSGGQASARFSLRTAPVKEYAESFNAAIIGDMGVNNSAATIMRLLQRSGSLNFTVHLGDVGYADDFHTFAHIEPSSGASYEGVYDLFQNMVEPIASAMPYMVMPGNHDVSCHVLGDGGCPRQQQNFSAFRYRFRMPSGESGVIVDSKTPTPHHNMWYSWQVGSVHFVSLSTESDFSGAPTTPHTYFGGGAGGNFGDQLSWLRSDLAKARKDPHVQFIVAMGHRPWYASKSSDWPLFAPKHVQAAFEPILYEFGVDLWLCAHKHYYERAKSAYKGKVDAHRGIVQIINGAAGNNEGLDPGKGVGEGLIVAAEYQHFGYGELALLNSTSLRWRYIRSSDGKVVDELLLSAREPPDALRLTNHALEYV